MGRPDVSRDELCHRRWQHLRPYLPGEAGSRLFQLNPDPSPLSAWQGYGVLLLWVAAAVAGAAVLLRRRDA